MGAGVRNTPARAGTTTTDGTPTAAAWEHPRAGGDDISIRIAPALTRGTPPRGRGRQVPRVDLPGQLGNTPARAGTTCFRWSPRPPAAEHPRAGGDDAEIDDLAKETPGTPPRGRGRPTVAE